MKWINAEQQVTVTIYDEEHEEHLDKIMTVEEMLDAYTNEGCPTIYSNPEPNIGQWIDADGDNAICGCCNRLNHLYGTYCKHCGAKMESEDKND